mmetsp:Transcript_17459/g.44514  ORF Transcript_17459/g.44514 Transcript_17459/m.44514 type:complete len:515 (-) Transcript_17459:704-2248(-)
MSGEHREKFRSIADIARQVGGFGVSMPVGKEFGSSNLVIHEIKLLAEAKGVDIRFKIRTNFRIVAVPKKADQSRYNTFHLDVHFFFKEDVWRVIRSDVSEGRGNSDLEPKRRSTSFKNRELATIVMPLVRADPRVLLQLLREALLPHVRHPSRLTSGRMSVIRRAAHVQLCGIPNENIQLLPLLQKLVKEAGHDFEYDTISGPELKQVIMNVARDEHKRRRDQIISLKKKKESLTAQQKLDLRDWDKAPNSSTSTPRAEWVVRNSNLLESKSDSSRRFVSQMFLSFNHARQAGVKLLGLFNCDAGHGQIHLSSYTLFAVLGFTSNFNIVTICYVWLVANESTASWKTVYEFVKKHFPWFISKATLASDRDKEITRAIDEVFPEHAMHHIYCVIHRKKNLAPFGKRTIKVYESMVYSETTWKVLQIRASDEYTRLSAAARSALDAADDRHQCLAVCTAKGGQVYGRSTSQVSESQSSALGVARRMDPVNSVLMSGSWKARASPSTQISSGFGIRD